MDAESFRAWMLSGIALFTTIGAGLMFVLKLIFAPVNENVKSLKDSVVILTETVDGLRNEYAGIDKRTTRLETTHEQRGCNFPMRRASDQ